MENKSLAAERRRRRRDEVLSLAAERLGSEAAHALDHLYRPYDERLYRYFANLWDPVIGGFYYSRSAKENEGFLPDIESTVQAMRCISTVGLYEGRGSLLEGTPRAMKDAIVRFARSLQSKDDGYFYHPQWGKDITVSRRGRDLSWAVGILSDFNEAPLYPTPLDRAQSHEQTTLPPYLCSLSAFREYLSSFEDPESAYYVRSRSYPMGNLLQSQILQIRAAGEEYVDTMFRWLEAQQLANGLWEDSCTYASVNGLMKISLLYSALGRRMQHMKEAIARAIETVRSPIPPNACVLVYNPWVVVSSLIGMLQNGDTDNYRKFRKIITNNAADMIDVTNQKITIFRKADGSYSYCPDHSSATSQGAPVALPGTNEGDVNATSILASGTLRSMCQGLGIPRIPLFCQEDGDAFFSMIINTSEAFTV